MKHKNLFYLFVVICIFVLFAGCSDFFGGNITTDIQFKINLNDLQLNSRSATPANEVAKLSVELTSQDKSVSLKQEQNIIDNTTDYFTFKNIKVGTIIKINATISQEDKELYVGETEWLDVKPSKNLISLVLEKIEDETEEPDTPIDPETPETQKTVIITFDTGNGYCAEITGTVGTPLTTPETTSKIGYTFAGWEPELPEVFPEEDTTFTALWIANTYTVTFHANGGEGSMPNQTFTYDEKQPLSEIDFRLDEYNFAGWSTTEGISGVQYYDNQQVSNLTAEKNGNVNLYAQWIEAGAFKIIYVLNNGTQNSANPNSYNRGNDEIPLHDPTRTGYTFDGWYTDAEFTNKIAAISANSTGDITLYAKWKGTITVTFPSYSDSHGVISPSYQNNQIQFIANSGYTCTWYLDDVKQTETSSTYIIDTTNMAGGIYTVMLIATNVDTGEMYSAEYQIEITK